MSPRKAEHRIVVGLTDDEVRAISVGLDAIRSRGGDAEARFHLSELVRRLEHLRNYHPAPLGAEQEEA